MKLRIALVSCLTLSSAVAGCTKEGPVAPRNLTPVHGIVTLEGKPLGRAVVTFCPVAEDGVGAAGITDDNGRFRLASFPTGDGAQPGEYRVTVVCREFNSYAQSSKPLVPAIYGVPTATPLTATVPSDSEIVLQLKAKP